MSSFNCHRCGKICKSTGGLTNHLKSCISKIKNKSSKSDNGSSKSDNCSSKTSISTPVIEDTKIIPQTVRYKGRDMIINWSGSEQYKNARRPGLYGGQILANGDDERNYLLDKSIGLIK